MLTFVLVRLAVIAAAFGVTSWLLDGMEMSGGVLSYLGVAIRFGLVNAIVGTIVRLVTLPLIILTLGLFAVLVNAFLLKITDALTDRLTIDEFWWTAIWAAIILALVTVVLELVVGMVLARRTDDARPALDA